MLPKNKLGRAMFKKLKVYGGLITRTKRSSLSHSTGRRAEEWAVCLTIASMGWEQRRSMAVEDNVQRWYATGKRKTR
jgi:hypothetical protein